MDKKKRQIILLMTDSTRQDMLGCYGNMAMNTPCLDAMAKEGIRYNNVYCLYNGVKTLALRRNL